MKNFLMGAFAIIFVGAVMGYATLVAYPNEQCGRIESLLKEKQENLRMYPGLTLTTDLKEACPSIESNLALTSQSSTNGDRDVWRDIEDFQMEERALQAENGIVSQ